MLSALIMAAVIHTVDDPVELVRTFQKGETHAYEVKSFMLLETKAYPLAYFHPSTVDINYDFTMSVKDLTPAGFASVLYERPIMYVIDGETAESEPVTHEEKVDWKMDLKLSPINEITDLVDLNPPKDEDGDGDGKLRSIGTAGVYGTLQAEGMIEELQRLALFVGDLNSSLDFAPKLPFDEVVPGDTWERTVSYQPQKLKSGKTVNQRLDYTFTFDGVKQWKGIDIHQITATLDLDTDAAPWLNEIYGVSDRESDLAKMPLTMDAKIIFRLDMETGLTLSAFAESKGGWEVFLKLDVQKSVAVQKIKGRTSLKLKKGPAE